MNTEDEYIRDKKYILETLEGNKQHTEKLNDNFESFKTEVTTTLAVIRTKLGMYAMLASLGVGIVIQVSMTLFKGVVN